MLALGSTWAQAAPSPDASEDPATAVAPAVVEDEPRDAPVVESLTVSAKVAPTPAGGSTEVGPAPQDDPVPETSSAPRAVPAPERNPWLGGLGFASAGIIAGSFGDIEPALRADDALGPDASVGPMAITLGGGGGLLVSGRYMFRGKGFGMFVPSSPTSRGRVGLTGGGGGLDVGMVIYNRRHWMLYPFFGVGGLGMSLDVDNGSDGDLVLGGRTIEAGATRTLRTGFATLELGFAFHREVFGPSQPGSSGHGGFIHGGEIGVMTSVAAGRWDDEGATVAMAGGQVLGGYLRLHFGGGGFFMGERPLRSRVQKRRRAGARKRTAGR